MYILIIIRIIYYDYTEGIFPSNCLDFISNYYDFKTFSCYLHYSVAII